MSIRKHGKGWQVRVRPFPEVTLPTKAAAQTLELDLKLKKRLGHLHQERPTTLGAELTGTIERKQAMGGRRGPLRPASVRSLEEARKPWAPFFDVPIPNLYRAPLEDHLAARAAVAPVAARNERQLLLQSLRAAASRGQRVDPGIFEIPPVRHEAAEGEALEYEALQELASWLPERIKRLVPFCGTVGLRFTEAVTLDDDRVDLDKGAIMIPSRLNKSRRPKPIPLAALEVQLLREQMLARPAGTNVVFANARGGVYSKSGFRKLWLNALLAAGLAHIEERNGKKLTVADFRFHWLRHTAISLMATAGMTPETIALRVGHVDGGALIYRRYRHLFPSELAAAVSRLDEAFAPARRSEEVVQR